MPSDFRSPALACGPTAMSGVMSVGPLPVSVEACPPPCGAMPRALGVRSPSSALTPCPTSSLLLPSLCPLGQEPRREPPCPFTRSHWGAGGGGAALSSWLETLWGSNWAASPPTENVHPSPPPWSLITCPQNWPRCPGRGQGSLQHAR